MNSKIMKGFAWKLLERFGVQGTQFLLQLILARLLAPEHYGALSLMLIFTSLANVFIQSGFNTALIQNKDVTEEDYSSVFWISLGIAIVLYIVIFLAAPSIGSFYNMPEIVLPLRVIAITLIPGSFNSIQWAKVNRSMDFKKVFMSNIGGTVVSGVIGVILAYAGAGLWALVIRRMLETIVACIVMFGAVMWVPKFVINWKRVTVLFSFGWKLLVSSLLETLYQELRSLVIGKKYDSGTLGYYNRGKQFPQFVVDAVNGTVQSVMLPAMSKEQDDTPQLRTLTRNSIMLSMYVMMPMMAGLAGVAPAVVSLMLTDKWLPCVPYMQIYCFSLAFYPVHSCNLQAINAIGRSDIFLKLEVIKKVYGLIILAIAVVAFDSPIAIAMTGVISGLISFFVNASPNKKLIGYSYLEQVKDVLPSFVVSLVMCGVVLLVGTIRINMFAKLLLQILVGVVVYLGISAMFRLEPYRMVVDIVMQLAEKRRR